MDDASGGLIGSALDDDEWIVTAAASGGTLPRPAEVIDAFSAWDTIVGTKWITAEAIGPDGLYVYEKCWCLNDAFENAQIDMEILADNEADVYLNGTLKRRALPRLEFGEAMSERAEDAFLGIGGALNLNVHFHTLVLDGSYDARDGMRFRVLARDEPLLAALYSASVRGSVGSTGP